MQGEDYKNNLTHSDSTSLFSSKKRVAHFSVSIFILSIIAVTVLVGVFISTKQKPKPQPYFLNQVQNLNPSSFPLIKNSFTTRSGTIVIDQNETGLVIKGFVDGKKPKWPEKITDNLALYDHVEVWLTDAKDTKLPPIGWGNQFGNPTLASEKDCDGNKNDQTEQPISDPSACKKWFENQVHFREQFKKLFVRQWQLIPNVAKESYASLAYSAFPEHIQKELKILQPGGSPSVTFLDNPNGSGYTFEMSIPWNTLPPIQSLDLKNLKILVDIFNPSTSHLQSGAYSSISGSHMYGDLTSFLNFTLSSPRQYSITSCNYDLGSDYGISKPVFSDGAVAYIVPSENLTINKSVMIDNTIKGYQYDPDASSISPTVYERTYFEKNIQPGEILCGPQLSYIKNSQIIKTKNSIASTSLDVRHITDDEVLVKNGPYTFYSYYGAGQCGACARGALNIAYLNFKNSTSTKAYSFESVLEPNDADFKISPDWKKIIEYDYGPSENTDNPYDSSAYKWSSTGYCFNSQTHLYDMCGKNTKATPPSPRSSLSEI